MVVYWRERYVMGKRYARRRTAPQRPTQRVPGGLGMDNINLTTTQFVAFAPRVCTLQ